VPDINFLIIGAQKAGTTSLFEYMRRHPNIYMPAEKEVSFFDRRYNRGKEWYLTTVLRNAPVDAICGEASVGYMGGAPFGEIPDNSLWESVKEHYRRPCEEVIPSRIKEFLPDVKLICVLRDPVTRAYSHYCMNVLDGKESRSFEDAIDQLMASDGLERSRAIPSDTNSYIVYGEYGRILDGFLRLFSRDQMMVIFSSELSSRPDETLGSVFRFVGVADDFMPENVEERYRSAAVRPKVIGFNLYAWQTLIARVRPARALWHRLPRTIRGQIDQAYATASFRVGVWNARRGVANDDIPLAVRQKLIAHFRSDGEALADILGVHIPWLPGQVVPMTIKSHCFDGTPRL
jgi:hypothetical protein